MSAGAAGALRRKERYIHGSAAPARQPYDEPFAEPRENPLPQRRVAPKAPARVAPRVRNAEHRAPGVSLFAIVGSLVVTVLMVFVMLAQVNLNEVSREAARLNQHLDSLNEQQKILAITFESVVDMKEVERYAKDVLGMSRPVSEQIAVIRTIPDDRVEVIEVNDEEKGLTGLGTYLTYLFDEYIR